NTGVAILNFRKNGNVTIKLIKSIKNGKLKDVDTIVLVGFGGGLTWGAMTIKWGK
ncbi:3-oxoacyl-[acyl-carrier-protein] synthase III C-terminal domain-containing protein, partial [Staphylococcus aureus]|uniref:3-oxoacyl-[acyl-carrier-protein] synthase III C-terminal domain-containing protein n=1 Tax=Staphylococcus aureus TaxID=1280 RepID=UPI00351F3BA4